MISTFADLKSEIANFANLAASSDYVARVPTFVQMAEAAIRRDVKCLDMLKTATGSMSSGVISQPSRFIEIRTLYVSPYGALDYMDPVNYYARTDWTYPAGYTVDGSQILVAGGGSSSYTLNYWQAYAALSADTDTNWLLANASDVYLYGALVHGAIYMKNAQEAAGYKQMFDAAVADVNSRAKAQMFAGPMRQRTRNYA